MSAGRRAGVSGETRLAAVIGDPVRHSLSPAIHNAAFEALGLDWVYVAFPVRAGGASAAIDAMRTLGIGGLNVTMPHKADVAAAVDRLTPSAAALGVCNTVFWDGVELVGDSTDGDGFIAALRDDGHHVSGKHVVVLGAGGAARSIVEAIGRNQPASLMIVNRTRSSAESAVELAPGASVGSIDAVAGADIVINTTSIGMAGSPNEGMSPLPKGLLHAGQIVADIVYQPRMTALLDEAVSVSAVGIGGIGMLVRQAGLAFHRWTGQEPPIPIMYAATGLPHASKKK